MQKSPVPNAKTLLLTAVALGLSNIIYALFGTFIRLSPEQRPVKPLPVWAPEAIYLFCGIMLVAAVMIFGKLAEKGRQALSEGDTTHQQMMQAISISNMMIEAPGIVAVVYLLMGHSITPLYVTSVLCALTSLGTIVPKVAAYVKEADMN
ncbi:MAG: hypothetical protein ACYC1M_16095 [Armatimonadota bacterium]